MARERVWQTSGESILSMDSHVGLSAAEANAPTTLGKRRGVLAGCPRMTEIRALDWWNDPMNAAGA